MAKYTHKPPAAHTSNQPVKLTRQALPSYMLKQTGTWTTDDAYNASIIAVSNQQFIVQQGLGAYQQNAREILYRQQALSRPTNITIVPSAPTPPEPDDETLIHNPYDMPSTKEGLMMVSPYYGNSLKVTANRLKWRSNTIAKRIKEGQDKVLFVKKHKDMPHPTLDSFAGTGDVSRVVDYYNGLNIDFIWGISSNAANESPYAMLEFYKKVAALGVPFGTLYYKHREFFRLWPEALQEIPEWKDVVL